jgi:MFS family permease
VKDLRPGDDPNPERSPSSPYLPSDESQTEHLPEPAPATEAIVCTLPWKDQRRNLMLFALCTGTQYLAAPVLYVGITQASLCDRLGADARTANLPGTLFFAMTAMPALIAWVSPGVSSLKRNLSLCYAASALMLTVLAVVLASDASAEVKIALVILQGGVSGAVMPAAIAFLWEAIGRGVEESKRGLALSLAFGVGPLLAVLGSLGQTSLLGGDLFGMRFSGWQYPDNFVILFGAAAPVMAVAAVLSQFLVIPVPREESRREPASEVIGLLLGLPLMFACILLVQAASMFPAPVKSGTGAGSVSSEMMSWIGFLCGAFATAGFIYHFRSILKHRILLVATCVTVLVYAGNVIPSNMNLYSQVALGDIPEKFAGQQNMLRFGFKVIAGALLGWVLTRTNPRVGILATSTIFLLAQIWAMFVTGPLYLLAFGIHGAGELIGVYAPNYIVSASRSDQLRRNMAFVTMLMVPAAPAGYLYGAIVDQFRKAGWTAFGLTSEALGFRVSFLTCALFILCGIVLAVTMLPARPGMIDSDNK